jgi:exonuclease SbcD
MNPDQVNEAIQERLARAIRSEAESLDPDIPAVLSGHLSVGEATLASEQSMMIGRDYVLMKSDLALPQLDYVALGHVHRHQVLNTRPHVVYSGSLQRIDFGEEKDRKGFCIVDLDPSLPPGSRLTEFSFEPVAAREFVTVAVEVSSGDLDPTATVLQAISRHRLEDAVVRVQIRLPATLEPHLRDADISQALEGAHFVASVSRELEEQRRTRLESDYTKAMDPREVLGVYLAQRDVSVDRAKVLMDYAQQLIEDDAED